MGLFSKNNGKGKPCSGPVQEGEAPEGGGRTGGKGGPAEGRRDPGRGGGGRARRSTAN